MIATLYGHVVRAVFLAASVAPSPAPSTSGTESPQAAGTGDPVAWAALVVSLAALVVSIMSAWYSRRQAIAAEKSVPPPPPDVAWRIEQGDKHEYALRNIGVKPATGVKVSTGIQPFPGHLSITGKTDKPTPPDSSLPLLMVVAYSNPSPNELLVSWDGNPEGTWVPMPAATE